MKIINKTITVVSFLFFGVISTYSQVAIGGKTGISSPSVSLEFSVGNRGMILPYVSLAADVAGAVGGTLVFDSSDKKVKMKTLTGWMDFSVDEKGIIDVTPQTGLLDKPNAKVSIGTPAAASPPGILVLEDSDKAMILPKVANPHLNIIKPSSGMMVYDTASNMFAVFNGTFWSFWKP